MAHCGVVLQKYRNLYVFSSIPAEHRHEPFKLAVKNSMVGGAFAAHEFHDVVSRKHLLEWQYSVGGGGVPPLDPPLPPLDPPPPPLLPFQCVIEHLLDLLLSL